MSWVNSVLRQFLPNDQISSSLLLHYLKLEIPEKKGNDIICELMLVPEINGMLEFIWKVAESEKLLDI